MRPRLAAVHSDVFQDEQLVERALRGNEQAFAELVTRYQERLLRFLQTRCRDRDSAEDALQDAFVDAWRYLDSFNPRWRFSTWLYRIAIRRAQAASAGTRDTDSLLPEPQADPLEHCIRGDERDNLWRLARRTLSADACTALWLHYVEELPQREVARALQRSLPWTKVTLLRARRRLRAAMSAPLADGKKSEAYG